MARHILNKRLEVLRKELGDMASLVEKQIHESIEALNTNNIELADKVIKNDDMVDDFNRKIEEQCIKFMATESPLARDLRKIFTTSKIVTDLERIADYAVDICKIAKRVEATPLEEEITPILQMVDVLSEMLEKSIDAFLNDDMDAAYKICKMDDTVDAIYRNLFSQIFKKMSKDENMINKGTQILFVSKYLERVGDHLTNICEWIIFSKKGEYVDLNE